MLTYKQKHRQANREALATVIGLAATIVVWALCGFGLSTLDVTVFHTPLWVVGGTLGTFAFSIVVTVVLAKRVFKDFDLDDTAGNTAHESAVAQTGAPSAQESLAPETMPARASERRHG